MFRRCPLAALLFLLAAAGCGAHAAEPEKEGPKFKYVGHVVFARRSPPPGYTQADLEKLGNGILPHLRMFVSPAVRVAYETEGEIDYSVGADERKELGRLVDELISRGERLLRMSFQLIATDKDYAEIMGDEADPRIANSHDFDFGTNTGTEAPLAEGDDLKLVKDGKVVGEWVLVGHGFFYRYTTMAHRMNDVGPGLQVLVLNSSDDLTEQDIEQVWDQDTEVIIKFRKEAAKKLESLTSNQDRQMGFIVDGRVEMITAPNAAIKDGVMGIYGKVRTPAHERLVNYLKGPLRGSLFRLVRSYVEGE